MKAMNETHQKIEELNRAWMHAADQAANDSSDSTDRAEIEAWDELHRALEDPEDATDS